jgi:hypothetical protein
MQNRLRIGYDPKYNFHVGYHKEIIEATTEQFEWIPCSIRNYSEYAILSQDPKVRSEIFNYGDFISNDNLDLLFSPHILLENPSTDYIIDIEDIWWLFGDTYEEVSPEIPIPKNKIERFVELILNTRLKKILWWSHKALERFVTFCLLYEIDEITKEKILGKSVILYPSSHNFNSIKKDDTEKNRFCCVFSGSNFYRKGGDIILKTFNSLAKNGITNWVLDIYGSNLEINQSVDNINIKVPIKKDDFVRKLANYDIFVHMTRADTFGTVLLDAINMKHFIVTTTGEAILAAKEILQDYPNRILIQSSDYNGTFNHYNDNKVYKVIADLIRNPRNISNYQSPYTRELLAKKFNLILSGIVDGR